MSVLSKLFSLRQSDQKLMDYEEAKRLAADKNARTRSRLAKRTDIQPEILYFLAEDSAAEVRREIAHNDMTPVQADQILARDDDEDVRYAVAGKIAKLAPDLTDNERTQVGAVVVDILETLARDELPRIRRIMSEELKDAVNLPVKVIERLARDKDDDVATPVLESSPLLSDALLVEIIDSKPVRGILGAIARRKGLGPGVSDAIVSTNDDEVITALLSNSSAQIREEALDELVDRAPAVEKWHAPLVNRPLLSARSIRHLSRFVAESLVQSLTRRKDIDTDTADALSEAMRRRLEKEKSGGTKDREDEEEPEERAERLHRANTLDEAALMAALEKGDRNFLTAALALKAGLSRASVQKAVSLESAKGVTAIAWKAGLTMAHAVQLQLRLSRIPPAKVLHARGDTFPLSPDEMEWQLEFFQS